MASAAFAVLVLDPAAVTAGRRVPEGVDLGSRPVLAGFIGAHAEVACAERLLRLLLRAHDPLEGGVARLVDRIGHGHDTGKRRLDHVVAVLGLALHLRLAVGDVEARGLRHHRQLQAVGDSRPQDGAVGIARLLSEEDKVGAFALECLAEHAARRDEVGPRRKHRPSRGLSGRRPSPALSGANRPRARAP